MTDNYRTIEKAVEDVIFKELGSKFINFAYPVENEDDIRSVTNNYINQTIQNFIFSIKLSFNLLDINYCNNNISNQIQIEDLEITHNNFIGYTKEAFFINFSIIVENHFRQISMHYENETKKINVIPIRQTFENLFNINKLLKFNNLLNENEFKTYYFFLSLRNTMHNIGVHTREDSSIEFNTSNSIFSFETKASAITSDAVVLPVPAGPSITITNGFLFLIPFLILEISRNGPF